jgi:hypothetical protein
MSANCDGAAAAVVLQQRQYLVLQQRLCVVLQQRLCLLLQQRLCLLLQQRGNDQPVSSDICGASCLHVMQVCWLNKQLS